MPTTAVIRCIGLSKDVVASIGKEDEAVHQAYMHCDIRYGDADPVGPPFNGKYVYHFTDVPCDSEAFMGIPCTCILSEDGYITDIGTHLPGECPHKRKEDD